MDIRGFVVRVLGKQTSMLSLASSIDSGVSKQSDLVFDNGQFGIDAIIEDIEMLIILDVGTFDVTHRQDYLRSRQATVDAESDDIDDEAEGEEIPLDIVAANDAGAFGVTVIVDSERVGARFLNAVQRTVEELDGTVVQRESSDPDNPGYLGREIYYIPETEERYFGVLFLYFEEESSGASVIHSIRLIRLTEEPLDDGE